MLQNHLFWLAVVLFFSSAININVYWEYRKTIPVLSYIIGLVGLFGLIGWSVRLFALSVTFNWWWLLGVGASSLLITGVLSFFTREKISLLIATFNILFIPWLWWYGSKFNSTATFNWFYNLVDAIQDFFS